MLYDCLVANNCVLAAVSISPRVKRWIRLRVTSSAPFNPHSTSLRLCLWLQEGGNQGDVKACQGVPTLVTVANV